MTDQPDIQPTASSSAPAAGAAPARRGRRTGLIAAVVGVLVVAGAVLGFVLVSGGGSDPERAVRDYDQVFKDADCEGFNDLTTSSFRGELGLTTCDKFAANAKDGSIASFRLKIRSSTVDGDASSVRTRETFTSSTGEQSINLVYSLVKDDGDWKVNKIAQDKGV